MIFIFGLFLFSSSASAATGINKQINFQGKVTNTDGTNVANNSYTFLFCIYTTASPSTACTSGADNDAVWRESKSITVTDGVFQTNLGDTTAFASLVDFNTDNIYLGINFNANGQMTPLVRFTAAPYAMNAGKVAGLTVTDTTGTLTIPAGKTVSFADAFTTSGAFATTLTSTATTNATLPAGTITLADLTTGQTLTNKIIGSTGLTFTGAATDITTGTGEDLTITANGSGIISLSDAVSVANTLTANGGISLTGGQSLTAGALSYVDLGSIVHNTTAVQGLRLPQAASATPSNPTAGEGYLAWDAAGNQLITYNGSSWTTIGGSIAADSLDFTDFKDTMALDGNLTLNQTTNTWAQTFTGDTTTGLTYTADSLTSGTAFAVSSSATAFTGSLANITLSGSNAANTGSLLALNNTGTANANTTLLIQHNATGTNNLAFRVNDIAADTTPFVIDGGGQVGIGTAAPTTPLELYGSGADIVSTITVADATYDPILKFRTGVSPSIQFSLGVDNSDSGKFKIYSGDGLGSGDEFTIDSNGVTTIANLNLGAVSFDADAGIVSWADMPVTSSASAGTVESYTAQIDGNALLTVYAESDGAGSIQNSGVSIGNASLQTGSKFAITQSSTSTTASSTLYGAYNSVTDTGVVTATGDNTYGSYTTVTRTGSTTAGTYNSYGDYVTVTADNAGAATSNAYGIYSTVSGADNNYSGVFMGGNFGIGDATPDGLLDLDFSQTSGTLYGASAPSGVTLAGTLTGISLNLSTNVTATGQSITAVATTLPAVTNTGAGSYNYYGENITGNAIIQNTGAGVDTFIGVNVTNPNITQTTGTVVANGMAVTTGSITTGGTQNGVSITATGVGAGTLYGMNISGVTAGAGTETAIEVGAGWDTGMNLNANTLINIGNAGTDFIASTGALTLAGVLTANGGISIGTQALTGSTGIIDYTNFDVDATGNITVAVSKGLDTNAAGSIQLGKTNATSVDICNSANCDTINIGNLATTDADTIIIGDVLDTTSINSTGWTITGAGALSVASVTVSGVTAANGGITFDASTDTVGAHTLSGTIDANANILTNIGNSGTDFVASTGALTLAGVLTANGGISLAGGQSLTVGALSYVDLGSIVHNTTAVQGIRLPQAASATPSNPTGGLEGYIAWDTAGNQLITYNGSAWSAVGGGSGYNLIKNETTGLTARTTLAFLGAGVDCADSGSQTECTIAGGSGADLQGTYDTDANGSDAIIALTATDGSLIFRNPASSGTGSGYVLKVDQLATGAVDGLQISNAGTGTGLKINATSTGSLAVFQNNGTDKVTFANNGALTINGLDSSITRGTSAEFASGTIGSNLVNANGRIEMSDGTPTSNVGAITTTSQPVVNANIGAGAMSISRPDGKYFVINGGAVLTTSIYDPMGGTVGTFTAGNAIIPGNSTGFGAGAIALPRANGMYTVVLGVAGATTAATANVDPQGNIPNTAGPALNIAITGAGTVAYKRPDGKYLVTIGASTPAATTNIFDPVANTFAAGPTAGSNWGAGSLAIPRPNGTALMVSGGSASTTAIYNPYPGAAAIGAFTVGPKLDGTQAAGTCGINGSGSVAIKRQDGQFLILSKGGAGASAVSALYDPVANTMTCRTSNGPSAALGDGAHAIPLQNGKFLIFRGGNTTDAWIYSQDTDAFAAWGGTTPVAITAGAHSILRTDGTWQTITGTNTCTNGCTFNFNTNLPMSDPFPSPATAGTPSSGGSCTAGTHAYYVTFITNSVESELSMKSNIASCTAGNGTVALTNIPVGPLGTTARKIYRTPAGDVGAPQLLNTTGSCSTAGGGSGITDNTSTTCSDTTADASLGSAYSVTAATTWYTSEDISSTSLSSSSTLRWNAQLEAVYAANRNTVTNTAFKVMQFFVKTAVNNSGCATPLANAQWQEIQNSGDLIHIVPGANCVKVSIHFNRAMPKRLFDDRGVWFGNGSTLLRYDYVTPTLFSFSIDNSAVLKRYAFDFSSANSNDPANPTIPALPSSAAPGGSGSCTSGNHYWFMTFVTNGEESLLSAPSVVQSCSGSNTETLTIATGPSGTTARKIYRTKAADAATDTPFYVGVVSDNSTTTFVDSLADSSLGAAFVASTPSGPVLSRGESSRVELVNNQLTLPWGRITPTTATANTLGLGNFYLGAFGADHPLLNNLAGIGTMVIARDDKTFLVIEAGNAAGTADLYDPVTQTFTNQTATGDKPTAATASGAFAIKRPDGKFLVVLGTGITTTACTTSGTATNIYDQYAAPGSRFTNGPCLSATAGQGAFAIQNSDGTFTILHGNATTSTTIYDPVRNTMTSGPVQTTGTNVGGLAIPLAGPMNNNYKIIVGTTLGGAVATTTMNYNANTKTFVAGANLTTAGSGSGAYAFQRADGWWILVKGTATNTTSIINPYNGVDSVGPTFTTSTSDRGGHVIPRADGTFLLLGGNAVSGVAVTTNIYFPWGGAFAGNAGANLGSTVVGPTAVLPGTGSVPAAPTSGTPTAGGSCTAGTHFWKYSYVTQGIESPLSAVSATQTCVAGTGQTVPLTVVSAGPTGTTERRIYRTLTGAAATAPYYYIGNIADNVTTTFSDTFADPAATNPYNGGGIGDGALSFQRPDGKYVTIFAGSTPSKTVNIYDAGWYSDGQYMTEQMNVPAMAANSTLDWQQTPDQFVRMEVRSASSQTALGVAGSYIVSKPGGSIGNAVNDNWVQVTVNFRRDFPTWSGALNGVYVGTGGMTYPYRPISMPTVNSFQITNGIDLMTLQNNGLNVLRVTSNGNIMSSTGGGFFSGGADLAENYTSTQALDKGEVVMIDKANPEAVLRSTGQYERTVLGVVSTAPGFVAGGYTQDSYPIALVGRVPVKVSTENGPIRAGDYLTASSIPGYAMRATQAGRALGKALESFDTEKAVACPSQGLGNALTTQCGSVMMFVNLTDYFGMPVDVVMAEQGENMNGVDGLTTDSGNHEESGLAISPDILLAVSAPAKERQTLGYLMKLRDARSSGGAMPASEIFTDRIAASTSITTPTLVADQIFAKSIKAESIEGLSIWTDQLQSLSEKYAGLEATPSVSNETGTNTQTASEQRAFAIALKNISTDAITVQLDGSILGKLSVGGALRIGGDAQFDGDTVFAKLATFLGETLFKEKVSFEKAPTFGSNTAGFAVIEEGAQSVTVSFDESYVKQPIITVSLVNNESPLVPGADKDLEKDIQAVEDDFITTYFESDVKFVVTKKNTKGFTIVLNQKAPRELDFSWVAIAVSGAKTSYSEKEMKSTPEEAIMSPSVPADTVTNSTPPLVPMGTPKAVVPQEEVVTPLAPLSSGNNTQTDAPSVATAP